ncbi:hypothetical protein [Phaeovulum sp. W22_SRMD_FR3]|uniref:hypothetical protein n=1 Tax=Phaeovulum sp. W22_SRMD_FR3 TaxID=3240274 RepID=UPI003F945521
MTKTILKFSRSWGRYNKGEVAGFAPDIAARLIGKVAVVFDPTAPVAVVNAAAQDAAAADLAAREAALAARERAVAEREAEVAEAEAFLIEPEEAEEEEPAPEPEKPSGSKAKDLPMQGKV